MKTVIFYNTAWYVYNFRRNLIRNLRDEGHEVIVLCPRDHNVARLESLGAVHRDIPLRPRGMNPLGEAVTIGALIQALRELRPDYVLSFTIKCNLYAGLARMLVPFRQIANVSGLGETFERPGLANSLVCTLYRLALRRAHCIFFQNREDLDFCVKRQLVPAATSRLLPGSGVDLSSFSPIAAEDSGRRTFLMFGRLLKRKGYDLFVEAARRVKQAYGNSVRFLVLGMPDDDRPESQELYERLKRADREGTITLLPPTDSVYPILSQADVAVLPSTYNEGVPRSLLEALACGKPVITTDWKGCRETVDAGRNGRLVPADDVNALARAIEEFATMPESQLKEMGRRSRSLAENRFDERVVIDHYVSQMRAALHM